MDRLARQAVQAHYWEWMPGMVLREERRGMASMRLCRNDGQFWHGMTPEGGWLRIRLEHIDSDGDKLPDFNDPTTAGCLLHLVRKAWGVETLSTFWDDDEKKFYFHGQDRSLQPGWESEVEACVQMLALARFTI